jgi:two-component system heavy metal sensor histidine kinase CusS
MTLSLTAVMLVMILGYWIARVGLRPLKLLSREAQLLSPRKLSQRLRISPLPAELSDLAGAFNGALGRLEAAYTQLESFNADVAHELRTPLTNLIGETQVALSRKRTAQQFQEVLQSNLEEIERLRSIVNDMLFLARADQGEAATGLVRAPVAREIGKTIEFLEFVLDETQETVKIDGDVQAEALIETALFRRAMANLLENAIEHSHSGAEIRVDIVRQQSQIRIGVANPGESIPPKHLPMLFDRFYRVDAARYNGKTHGHGLGLAIVKAIATMHGGDVFASSADGITTIGFSVPAAEAA